MQSRHKRYYFRSETPLTFYRFLQFLIVPYAAFDALVTISSILGIVADHNISSVFVISALFFPSIILITSVLFEIGSFRYAEYAFVSVHVLFWTKAVLFAVLTMDAAASPAELFASIVWALVVTIYFYKRKPLFYTSLIPKELLADSDEDE